MMTTVFFWEGSSLDYIWRNIPQNRSASITAPMLVNDARPLGSLLKLQYHILKTLLFQTSTSSEDSRTP